LLLDRLEVTTSLHRALYVRINMDLGTPGREWEHSNHEAAAENDASDKAFAISSQSDLVHSCEVRLLFPTMGELGIDDEIQDGHFVIVIDDDPGVIRKPFIAPAIICHPGA
jgi:hypothetical protein